MHTYITAGFPFFVALSWGYSQPFKMEMSKTKSTKPDGVRAASAQAQMKWKVVGIHVRVSKSYCHVKICKAMVG